MEDYDEDFLIRQSICRLKEMGIALLIAIAICLLFGSCKTVYVPVESTHSDTLYINKWQHDSVWIEILKQDSVVVKEKGDTVLVEHWKTEWRDRWRDREFHDTTYISKSDTIQVPVPIEKKISFWEQAKLTSIGFSASIILIAVIGLVIWIRKRYRRK